MHLVVGEKASSPMAVWISFKRCSLPLLLKCFLAYLRWEVMEGGEVEKTVEKTVDK